MDYIKLKEFLSELKSKSKLTDFLDNVQYFYSNYEDVTNEEWKVILQKKRPEDILCILSEILDEDYIKDNNIINYFPFYSDFYLSYLELKNYPMNKKSSLLEFYKYNNEFLIYSKLELDENKIKDYENKYKFENKYDEETNKFLIDNKFLVENYREYIIYTELEYDNWERKHFLINIFFEVWEYYKNGLDIKYKEDFKENILPYFYKILNWRTVSRKFNPEDEEFVKLFNKYIDYDFAKKYNSYYKSK